MQTLWLKKTFQNMHTNTVRMKHKIFFNHKVTMKP